MRRRGQGRRFLRYFFLIVAAACLGDYFYATLDRQIYQERENRSFDRELLPPVSSANTPLRAAPNASAAPNESTPAAAPSAPIPERPKEGVAIGRISIPRLGVRAVIDEGIDDGVLRRAVGHLPGTAFPGEQGNVAIAGHRDTFFRQLRRLHENDEIDVQTDRGKFRYRVDSMVVVDPKDTAVIAPTATNTLTLVTCFPFYYIGNAPRRFIVRATQMQEPNASAY